MEKEFVPYEIALKLKELGFDGEVIATFDTSKDHKLDIFAFSVPNKGIFEEGFKKGWCIKAPLWQQAIDWFREKYNLYLSVEANFSNKRWYFVTGTMWEYNSGGLFDDFKTYEKAREQAILKAINLIDNKIKKYD